MSQEKVRKESFEFVEQDTDGLLYLEPLPPQVFETTKVEGARVYHTLVLSVRHEDVSGRRIGIVTDYVSGRPEPLETRTPDRSGA